MKTLNTKPLVVLILGLTAIGLAADEDGKSTAKPASIEPPKTNSAKAAEAVSTNDKDRIATEPVGTETVVLGDPGKESQLPAIGISVLAPREVAFGDVIEISNALPQGLVPGLPDGLNQQSHLRARLSYNIDKADDDKSKDMCSGAGPVPVMRTIRVPVTKPAGRYLVAVCSADSSATPSPRLVFPITIVNRPIHLTSAAIVSNHLTISGSELRPGTKFWVDCGGGQSDLATIPTESNEADNTVSVFDDSRAATIKPKSNFGKGTLSARICRVSATDPEGRSSNDVPLYAGQLYREDLFQTLLVLLAGLLPPLIILAIARRAIARPVSGLVMDEGASRISLSRIQLFLTAYAAVCAVVVLWLLDGGTEDSIPTGLLAVFFAAVITAAIGTYLNYKRWADGPAQTSPGLSDLISEFGLVHWERVFFLLCVVLTYSFTFGNLALKVYEGVEYTFDLPPWMVLLNAVFAALFLSGKVFRVAGPRIRSVEAAQGSLDLTVTGAGLSPDAEFSINSSSAPRQQRVKVTAGMIRPRNGQRKPEVVAEDYGRRGYASVLRLRISDPNGELCKPEKSYLTVRNPDGQEAHCSFDVPLAITGISQPVVAGGEIQVCGRGFEQNCAVFIVNETNRKSDQCKVTLQEECRIRVHLPKIQSGPHLITVKNPSHGRASRLINVEATALEAKSSSDVDPRALKGSRENNRSSKFAP